MRSAPGTDVAVLGAGLQGVCAALALADAGHHVTIVDAADDCMRRASLRNEGKIHLGLVYANDPTGRTPALMLEGALRFGPLLERWVGTVPWARLRARPFTYLVLEESMLAPADVFAAYEALEAELDRHDDRDYVGTHLGRLWQEVPVDDLGPGFARDRIAAAAATAEVALDPGLLADLLRAAVAAHPRVTTRFGHAVAEVTRTVGGFALHGTRTDGEGWRLDTPVAVNCLWDRRLALDARLGITPDRPWTHRLKYRVLGRLAGDPTALPSLTMVLGRFGDVVVHPDRPTYLSWYPACLAGWDQSLAPPPEWDAACAGHDPRARSLGEATVAGLAEIVPALAGFRVETVDAGVIVAWGDSDIDDPGSELHERHAIGVADHDGWYSVDTGKLTTAPLFADRLATLVGPPS